MINFPNPGSFRDFRARTPEITSGAEAVKTYTHELMLWRSTNPDVETTTLGEREQGVRVAVSLFGVDGLGLVRDLVDDSSTSLTS